MPELSKILKKILHHRCLTGFKIFLTLRIWQGSKYASIRQGFGHNAPLQIFERVLERFVTRVLLTKSCQFCANFIPEIHGILNTPQVFKYATILNVSGILICQISTGYINRIQARIQISRGNSRKLDIFEVYMSMIFFDCTKMHFLGILTGRHSSLQV